MLPQCHRCDGLTSRGTRKPGLLSYVAHPGIVFWPNLLRRIDQSWQMEDESRQLVVTSPVTPSGQSASILRGSAQRDLWTEFSVTCGPSSA